MVVGFIGLGNMAKAMINGIISEGVVSPDEIMGSSRTQATCDKVKKEFDIFATTDNLKVATNADLLIIAVKPQMFDEVAKGIKGVIKKDAIVVSIVAGKSLAYLGQALGDELRIVRLMPNTPAMVNAGVTAICANDKVGQADFDKVVKICESFGVAISLPEKSMDAFTAVAGSSPAYVFMYMEALADAAVKGGIPREQAYTIAAMSTLGSAKLMLDTGKHPGVLKDMVCSPGGTTIEAVQVLEDMGFRAAVLDAVEACIEKAKKL